eukprot:GHRR01007236.1.p1 GENE.GHRR01007236.1~~GHRR01007236.1.p1  ORF type:complete len:224 (+),score=51.45 GHRR01007236.1:135-806(+)
MASLAYLPALMPMSRALLALVIVSTVVGTSHCLNQDGDVVILGDTNFDQLTSTGVWLVDIYAPWCSHCQQLEPTWHALAREMDAHGVNVAKVDGMQNKVLMKRFGVVGFPSIFLLRDGQTWQYTGMRSVGELKDFALKGYRQATPMPFHKAPNSLAGRLIGMLHSFPALAKRAYDFLKEEKGFSDMTIISGVLLIPLAIGMVFICFLDAMYTRQPHLAHQHIE